MTNHRDFFANSESFRCSLSPLSFKGPLQPLQKGRLLPHGRKGKVYPSLGGFCIWMVVPQSGLAYFQRLRVVALGLIHQADIVVGGGSILVFFAIQLLGEGYLAEPDRFGIVVHAVLIEEYGVVEKQVAVFLLVVVGLGGPAVGFLVEAHHFDDAGGDELALVGKDAGDLRQQVVDVLVQLLHPLLSLHLPLLKSIRTTISSWLKRLLMSSPRADMDRRSSFSSVMDEARNALTSRGLLMSAGV